MGKDASEIRREIEATRDRMSDTVEALGYKADVPGRVKDALNDRVETVKGAIGGVVDRLPDSGEMRDAAQRGAGIAAENPLGLAIAAAALGFLAGLMMPVSDYERKVARPLRDELLGRAQSLGNDALERGKRVLGV
jgi:Protein of unknown function (DUF3618)